MREMFLNCKDGDTFDYNGKKYMRVTGMVAVDLETEEWFLFTIDF